MIPFYLLDIERFDLNLKEYSTPAQLGLSGIADRAASISFKKQSKQILEGFTKYNLICEIPHNEKGRAYGSEDIFDHFVVIKEKVFYYSTNINIIILSAPKEVSGSFTRTFSNSKPSVPIKVKKIDPDFLYIINNQHSKGIEGVWLGEYPDTNIESMYILGNKIENSSQYHDFLERGAKIKNLTILYNFNNQTKKIMITKEGGIILYQPLDESDSLVLIEDIYSKLLLIS